MFNTIKNWAARTQGERTLETLWLLPVSLWGSRVGVLHWDPKEQNWTVVNGQRVTQIGAQSPVSVLPLSRLFAEIDWERLPWSGEAYPVKVRSYPTAYRKRRGFYSSTKQMYEVPLHTVEVIGAPKNICTELAPLFAQAVGKTCRTNPVWQTLFTGLTSPIKCDGIPAELYPAAMDFIVGVSYNPDIQPPVSYRETRVSRLWDSDRSTYFPGIFRTLLKEVTGLCPEGAAQQFEALAKMRFAEYWDTLLLPELLKKIEVVDKIPLYRNIGHDLFINMLPLAIISRTFLDLGTLSPLQLEAVDYFYAAYSQNDLIPLLLGLEQDFSKRRRL